MRNDAASREMLALTLVQDGGIDVKKTSGRLRANSSYLCQAGDSGNFLVALVVRHLKHNTVYLYLFLESWSIGHSLLLDNNGNSSHTLVWLVYSVVTVFSFCCICYGAGPPNPEKAADSASVKAGNAISEA